jgi:hypothetical protein
MPVCIIECQELFICYRLSNFILSYLHTFILSYLHTFIHSYLHAFILHTSYIYTLYRYAYYVRRMTYDVRRTTYDVCHIVTLPPWHSKSCAGLLGPHSPVVTVGAVCVVLVAAAGWFVLLVSVGGSSGRRSRRVGLMCLCVCVYVCIQ